MPDDYTTILVSAEKDLLELGTRHLYTFQIRKQHQKTIKSILRQMFDNPNVKFSSKLTRLDK